MACSSVVLEAIGKDGCWLQLTADICHVFLHCREEGCRFGRRRAGQKPCSGNGGILGWSPVANRGCVFPKNICSGAAVSARNHAVFLSSHPRFP